MCNITQYWCIHKNTRYDGVVACVKQIMNLIGQNDSQQEGNMDHIFPCTPLGGKMVGYIKLIYYYKQGLASFPPCTKIGYPPSYTCMYIHSNAICGTGIFAKS